MREPTAEIRQMPASTVRASPITALASRLHRHVGTDWLRTYLIAIGIAALLCLTGANGTEAFPLGRRLAFWLSVMILGTAIAQVTHAWLDRALRLRVWQEVVVMTLAITPPITVVVWLVTAILDGVLPQLAALPVLVLPVLVISACMAMLHATVNRVPLQSHVHAAAPAIETAGEAFRARLEFKYRQAEILALSAEDHYLRVHAKA